MSKVFLTMDSAAFNGFKADCNAILNSTFATMQEKDVDKATITAKFEIALIPGIDKNGDEAKDYIAPMIKHKITANMKLQSEKAGILGGPDWALIWDSNAKKYAMIAVNGDQASMFDEDFDFEEDDL